MASVALTTFGRHAFANQNVVDAHGLSDASLEAASRRVAELVNRTLEEMTQQLVHHAPALPKLTLERYNYWSEALHGVNVDGPIT
jgi:hypothetical protein